MALPAGGLYTRYRHLIPELLKFGVVGGIGSIIDLGGAAVLHGKYHVGPLESKAISTTIATTVTYLGSRFWTFKHRENQALGREAGLFIVFNLVGLLIAEAVIALVTYGLGLHGQLEYNAASVVGTGLATIFRYLAYRQWVFTAPAEQSVLVPAASDELELIPDYPPWEGDPAYLAAEVTATASWESDGAHSWGPASEARSWERGSEWEQDPERTQPWMEFSNDPVTSPFSPASAGTGQSFTGGADPAGSGSRGQGRHRRS